MADHPTLSSAQRAFLEHPKTQVCAGSGIGVGKTTALLTGLLEHIGRPTYVGGYFRRDYQGLTYPGGPIDQISHWLSDTPCRFSRTKLRWTFPSGAVVLLGWVRDRARMYSSIDFDFIAIDEIQEWAWQEYDIISLRLRRRSPGIPQRIRVAGHITNNPPEMTAWQREYFLQPSEHRGYVEMDPMPNPYLQTP